MKRIAIQGIAGCFHETAARRHFPGGHLRAGEGVHRHRHPGGRADAYFTASAFHLGGCLHAFFKAGGGRLRYGIQGAFGRFGLVVAFVEACHPVLVHARLRYAVLERER